MWHGGHDGGGVGDVLIDNHNQTNDAADDKLALARALREIGGVFYSGFSIIWRFFQRFYQFY